MAYASVMVHAEAGAQCEARLRLAVGIANLFEATLIGVGAEPALPAPEFASPDVTGQRDHSAQTHIRQAARRFDVAASYAAAGHEWRPAADDATQAIIREARAADLVVLSPVRAGEPRPRVDPGEVLMRSGRPILVAPQSQTQLAPCRVVVGWKDTRESRRALSDALPFLRMASHVRVVEICGATLRPDAEEHVKDVAAALARHGVTASGDVIAAADAAAAGELRNLCEGWEADLLVVGGYGHTRTREWVLGGVTRALLADCATPLLLSH